MAERENEFYDSYELDGILDPEPEVEIPGQETMSTEPKAPEAPSAAPKAPEAPSAAPEKKEYKSVFFTVPSAQLDYFETKAKGTKMAAVTYPVYEQSGDGKTGKPTWNKFVVPRSFLHKDQWEKGLSYFGLSKDQVSKVTLDVNNKDRKQEPVEINNVDLQKAMAAGYREWAAHIEDYAKNNLAAVQKREDLSPEIKKAAADRVKWDFDPPEKYAVKRNPDRSAVKAIRNHRLKNGSAYSPEGLVEGAQFKLEHRRSQTAEKSTEKAAPVQDDSAR